MVFSISQVLLPSLSFLYSEVRITRHKMLEEEKTDLMAVGKMRAFAEKWQVAA